MLIEDYERFAVSTDLNNPIEYYFEGLAEEAGEVNGLRKRLVRGDEKTKEEFRERLIDELGDVFWYIVMLAQKHQIGFGEITTYNMDKLSKRQKDGTLRGQNRVEEKTG